MSSPTDPQESSGHIQRAKHFVHRHKKWEPVVFFVAGFTFDAMLLHRIDDPLMLVHQCLYLFLSGFIIAWDLIGEVELEAEGQAENGTVAPGFVKKQWLKLWSYREGILHFLLGTLLNVYTIFYFKSGTILSSLVFLSLLAALLFLNEARPTKLPKHMLRNALFGLCLVSYMNIVVSILIGQIGILVFLAAIVAASAVHALFVRFLQKKLSSERVWREIRLPFIAIVSLYVLLYVFKVLPPVPLSVKHIGIYHSISKVGDEYQLGYSRSTWRFWESGDQTFEARPGDKIFCFVQVISPARFNEQLFVRWQYYDPQNGWMNADAIPIKVSGGREEGYRGFTTKSNYQPGSWRVSVETNDGREVGRIGFTLVTSESTEPVDLHYETR